jgi:DNA-directed RNA polymerase specialized sigma subunit
MDFTETRVVSSEPDPDLIHLDEVLKSLERIDARKAQVVEMRYFGGLTAQEIAAVLNISPQLVYREWVFAKTWLTREMSRTTPSGNCSLGSRKVME